MKEEEEAAAAEDAVVRMRSLPREWRDAVRNSLKAHHALCPLSATVKPPSREGRQKHAKTRPFDCALRL